jgi:hypothetical protein
MDERPIANVLRALAKDTGGQTVYNTNKYNEELDKIALELSNYYVIGFISNNPKRDGKFRMLKVMTSAKSVTVKHRDRYYDTRPVDVLAGLKEEATLISALTSPSASVKIPIALRAVYFYDSRGVATVPIMAKYGTAPIELKLTKKGLELGSNLMIMGVAYAEDGSIAARFSDIRPILFDKKLEEEFRKQQLTYRNYFKLNVGKYTLKLAITDEAGNVGTAEQALVVPAFVRGSIAASSLIVAEQQAEMPTLVQNFQQKLLAESDPFIVGGVQISPSIDNQWQAKSAIPLFFKVYNLNGSPELVSKVQLLNEKGEVSSNQPSIMDQNVTMTSKTEALVNINLLYDDLIAGKYKLAVETSDGKSKQSVTVQTDMLIK